MRFKKRSMSIALAVVMMITVLPAGVFADADKTYQGTERTTPGSGVSTAVKTPEINDLINKDIPQSVLDAVSGKMKAQKIVEDDSNGDYIWWNGSNNFTLYKGQKLHLDFDVWDAWDSWYTIPWVLILNDDGDAVANGILTGNRNIVDVDSWTTYSWYWNIGSGSLPAGSYCLAICAMPCFDNGGWADGEYYNSDTEEYEYTSIDDFDIPTELVYFRVKKLSKPTSLKATAGKKKVTITYRKAKGASKYQIYRSTRKSGGYKKIATTGKTKYIDKKAKKGKRYYYKVRARRGSSKSGYAYSYYTSPKRSGRVK